MTAPVGLAAINTSAEAEAMHARLVVLMRLAARLDIEPMHTSRVVGLILIIGELVKTEKTMIVMAGDDGMPAFYPSEAMMTAMDDLDAVLRPRRAGPAAGLEGVS